MPHVINASYSHCRGSIRILRYTEEPELRQFGLVLLAAFYAEHYKNFSVITAALYLLQPICVIETAPSYRPYLTNFTAILARHLMAFLFHSPADLRKLVFLLVAAAEAEDTGARDGIWARKTKAGAAEKFSGCH